MKTIEITKASESEKGLTIRTSQLSKKFNFINGDEFVVVFEDNASVVFKASRNGSTLYAGAKNPGIERFKPQLKRVSGSIFVNVKSIKRI